MTVIYALVAALFGAAAGWFASSFLFYVIAVALGASEREGALAMGAVFGVGPVGAIVGAVAGAGLVIYLRRGKQSSPGRAALIVLAIVAAAFYGGYTWLNAGTYRPQFPEAGPRPVLNFEIEVADAGWPQPADYDGRIELHSFDRFIYPDRIDQQHEAGLHRVSGRIPLLHKYEHRQFAYWLSMSEVYYFNLKLPAVPDAQDDFGDWFVADHVGDRNSGTSKPAAPDSPVRMRMRITWQ